MAENQAKTNIFTEPRHSFSLPIPPRFMDKVAAEGAQIARKRNDHLIAILARHFGEEVPDGQ